MKITPTKPKEIKELEQRIHEYKGIRVLVEIDYKNNTISLLQDRKTHKSWVFARRQIGYMEGWRNILDAMKSAIDSAEKDLRVYLEEQGDKLAGLAKLVDVKF